MDANEYAQREWAPRDMPRCSLCGCGVTGAVVAFVPPPPGGTLVLVCRGCAGEIIRLVRPPPPPTVREVDGFFSEA